MAAKHLVEMDCPPELFAEQMTWAAKHGVIAHTVVETNSGCGGEIHFRWTAQNARLLHGHLCEEWNSGAKTRADLIRDLSEYPGFRTLHAFTETLS